MAAKYDHLRAKAISLRTEKHMTLDEIVECLSLPKTTVYYWIKDLPIPARPRQQHWGQRRGTEAMQAKYAAKREAAYQQGCEEAPELLKNPTFRDFVVLYMAEGYKRDRNDVVLGNSDPRIVKLAHDWLQALSKKECSYQLQYHTDHDVAELQDYWGSLLGVAPSKIKASRKSNSNQLTGRKFRSVYGIISVGVGDTYLRARLQAWMDYVKAQW